MTRNQKIAIGLGALALGYWLYTKNKANKSVETPATSSNPANIKLPEGSTIFVRSHEYIPTTIEKRAEETNFKIFTCKDGFKTTEDVNKWIGRTDPCLKHGGILSRTNKIDNPYQKDKYGMPRVIK